MHELMLILHLFGLGAAVTSGIGNTIVGAKIAAAPDNMRVLGQLTPIFARVGQVGLGLLWITGPIMVWTEYDRGGALPSAFTIKMAGVVVLTVLVILMGLRIRRVMGGDLAAAKPLPTLGRIAGATLIFVVTFAVIAFN